MTDVVQVAESVEKLGIIGVLAALLIVGGGIIARQWRSAEQKDKAHKEELKELNQKLLKAVQGKDIE